MRRIRILAPALVTAMLAVACGGGNDDISTATTSTTGGETTTTSIADASTDVRVYFVRGETIATAGRSTDEEGVATAALTALLAGPNEAEVGIGMSSEIPAGTTLNDVSIDDGTAVVDLSETFDDGGGSLSMSVRVAQVVFTATQFDTVDRVTIEIDGAPTPEGIGGEGVPSTDLERADVGDVVPAVLIESPVPFQTVSSPVTISGWSNTFEATVLVRVSDVDDVLASDFTTATAGTGTWGSFATTLSFEPGDATAGTVTGYEESARDGSDINVYDVPVAFG